MPSNVDANTFNKILNVIIEQAVIDSLIAFYRI